MSDWWLKIARDLGKAVGEFQKVVEEVQEPIEQATKDVRDGLSEPPLLVFVSSIMNPTCDDLVAERAAAKRAIEKLPLARAWLFEYSPASPETAPRVYLRKVKECDIFVLVLGKEITYPVLREYATARKHKRWRLAFLKNCERTLATQTFVRKIGSEVKWKDFGAFNDLEEQVYSAILNLLLLKFRDKLTANEIIVLTGLLSQLTKPEAPLPAQPTESVSSETRIEIVEPEPPRSELPSLFSPQFIRGRDGKRMILIPAGEFWRGTSDADISEMQMKFGWDPKWFEDEKPQRKIYLDAYYIDETPVTNAEYKRFLDADRSHRLPSGWDETWRTFLPGKDDHPVVNVSWDDATAYARWAGKRLPTEAEWEKAARGREGQRYPWGNEQPDANRCNFGSNVGTTTPVGKYSPHGDSPYHVKDMVGNVWEWVADWYDANYYKNSPARNPKNETAGTRRVLRGGSWGSSAYYVRAAIRGSDVPENRYYYFGFRCAQ